MPQEHAVNQPREQPAADAKRLLVVDDSSAVRDVLAIKLRREGYDVTTAERADEALAKLATGPFDLMLLDVRLPDADGLALLRQLREKRNLLEMPIIMISGLGQPEDIVKALHDGANDYVTKPIDLGIALARVRTQLTLRELKQAKDRFLQIASHDLKKPIMLVLDIARQLRHGYASGAPMTDDAHASLSFIIETGEYMQDIVEDLLGWSAIREGRMRMTTLPTDLGAIVRQAVTRNSVYAASKRIHLRMEFTSDIPPIPADDSRIMQVLENLIGNAIKFSPEGKTITVRTFRDGDSLVCEISDQGPGIPDADRGKLFAAYARLSNKPTGGETSSGLGLAICKEMIHLHGGKIGARNNPDAGATFWFRLPCD
jgi:signal transduction histidine kinase